MYCFFVELNPLILYVPTFNILVKLWYANGWIKSKANETDKLYVCFNL